MLHKHLNFIGYAIYLEGETVGRELLHSRGIRFWGSRVVRQLGNSHVYSCIERSGGICMNTKQSLSLIGEIMAGIYA